MIPFQKIFTLIIRTFSKPMLSLMKKKQQQGKYKRFRWFFVSFGRKYQIFQHWLNHRLLKTTHKKQLTELKEQVLLQKGVQSFYQLFFYSIVIGLPMYELYKSTQSANKKQEKLKSKIESMEKKLDTTNQSLASVLQHLNPNKNHQIKLAEQRESKIQKLILHRYQSKLISIEEQHLNIKKEQQVVQNIYIQPKSSQRDPEQQQVKNIANTQ